MSHYVLFNKLHNELEREDYANKWWRRQRDNGDKWATVCGQVGPLVGKSSKVSSIWPHDTGSVHSAHSLK